MKLLLILPLLVALSVSSDNCCELKTIRGRGTRLLYDPVLAHCPDRTRFICTYVFNFIFNLINLLNLFLAHIFEPLLWYYWLDPVLVMLQMVSDFKISIYHWQIILAFSADDGHNTEYDEPLKIVINFKDTISTAKIGENTAAELFCNRHSKVNNIICKIRNNSQNIC